MHKLLVLYPPQPNPEKFKTYYVDVHMPLVAKIPGLQTYRYSFSVEGPFFCVFEAEFADGAALGAGMASAEGQAAVADVPNFAEGAPTIVNYRIDGTL